MKASRFRLLTGLLGLGLALAAPALATPAALAPLTGQVVKVADGDTVTVLVGREQVRVRLEGIDAPEKKQAFGARATEYARGLAALKTVTVRPSTIDKYGRTVGVVILPDGASLNREMVRAGYAWWYRQYSGDKELGRLEAEARLARRGLWQERNPQPPWEWRRAQKDRRRTAPLTLIKAF